jgi:hypothetical protein
MPSINTRHNSRQSASKHPNKRPFHPWLTAFSSRRVLDAGSQRVLLPHGEVRALRDERSTLLMAMNAGTHHARVLRFLVDARCAWVAQSELIACAAQYNPLVVDPHRMAHP